MSTYFCQIPSAAYFVPSKLTEPSPAALKVLDAMARLYREHRRGLSNAEVAAVLKVTKQTVIKHVKNLERFNLVTRSGVHNGLVPVQDAEGASLGGDDVRLPHRSSESSEDAVSVDMAEHLRVDPATGETIQLAKSIPDLGFEAGEILVIDTNAEPEAGDAVAWKDRGRVRVSRFGPRTRDIIGVVRSVIRQVH